MDKNVYKRMMDQAVPSAALIQKTKTKMMKEESNMGKFNIRKSFGATVAACIVVVLAMSGVALAMTNTWGILDFLSGRGVLPEASEIVQTLPPQEIVQTTESQESSASELATFFVREAVFDGQTINIVVDVKPESPDYLLVGMGAGLDDPIRNTSVWYEQIFEGNDETVREYAEKNDKIPLYAAVTPFVDGLFVNGCGIDIRPEADGSLVYMLSGPYVSDSPQLTLDLRCFSALYSDDGRPIQDRTESALTVTLQNSVVLASAANVNTAEYADYGVRVDRITLKNSPLAIYAEIEYTVIDEEIYKPEDGVGFAFVDENGNNLPDGRIGGSTVPADDSGTRFISTTSIQAAETMPETLILRAFNIWDREQPSEYHTFEMR